MENYWVVSRGGLLSLGELLEKNATEPLRTGGMIARSMGASWHYRLDLFRVACIELADSELTGAGWSR